MSVKDKILESSVGYTMWSSMFDGQKISTIVKLLPNLKDQDVLDVGCGPGTNTAIFNGSRYFGVDINPSYIESARKKFPGRQFLVSDANGLSFNKDSFDFIFIGSIIHHMDNQAAKKLFETLYKILKPNGAILISEPLRTEEKEVFKYFMMRMDRGKFFRTMEELHELFGTLFCIEEKIAYPLKVYGKALTVSNMIVARLRKKAA
jgi:ubiquinone/menaquinone biosynthesis C-methylase UbiE